MAVWNVDEPVYYIRELMFSSPLHLIRHNKYMWISVVTNFYKRFLRYIDSRFPYLFVSNMVAWESLLFFTFTRNLAIHNLSVLLRRQLTIFATLLTMSGCNCNCILLICLSIITPFFNPVWGRQTLRSCHIFITYFTHAQLTNSKISNEWLHRNFTVYVLFMLFQLKV